MSAAKAGTVGNSDVSKSSSVIDVKMDPKQSDNILDRSIAAVKKRCAELSFKDVAVAVVSGVINLVFRAGIVMLAWNWSIPTLIRKDLNLFRHMSFGAALALIILITTLVPITQGGYTVLAC